MMAAKSEEVHHCIECVYCVKVTEPSTMLSLEGKPILGRCWFWTESRSFLLSQKSCKNFDKREENGTD